LISEAERRDRRAFKDNTFQSLAEHFLLRQRARAPQAHRTSQSVICI